MIIRTYETTINETDYTFNVAIEPFRRGNVYGAPDFWTPDEGGCAEIISVHSGDSIIDPDFFNKEMTEEIETDAYKDWESEQQRSNNLWEIQ